MERAASAADPRLTRADVRALGSALVPDRAPLGHGAHATVRRREPMDAARRLAGPRTYRAAVVDLLGRPGVRRAHRLHPAGGRLRPRPDAAAQGGAGRPGGAEFRHYETLVAPPARSWASTPRRRWRRSSRPSTPSTSAPGPSGWLEGLVKAYVGDGIATDFYREISRLRRPRDPGARRTSPAGRRARPSSSVKVVREAIKADRSASPAGSPCGGAGCVGEALSQAQRGRGRARRAVVAARRRWRPAGCRPRRARAGCSPGSPTSTPAGWAASAWPPEPAPIRRPARTAGDAFPRPAGTSDGGTGWACLDDRAPSRWTAPFAWSRGSDVRAARAAGERDVHDDQHSGDDDADDPADPVDAAGVAAAERARRASSR